MKVDRHNLHKQFAVNVKKDDVTIGHLPWKISRMHTLFSRQGLPVAMRTCQIIQHPYMLTGNKVLCFKFLLFRPPLKVF